MAHGKSIKMDIKLDADDVIHPGYPYTFYLKITTNRPIKIITVGAVLETYGQLLRAVHGWVDVGKPQFRTVAAEVYARERVSSDPDDSSYNNHAFCIIRVTEGDPTGVHIHEGLPPTKTSTVIVTVRLVDLKDIPDSCTCRGKVFGFAIRSVLRGKLTYKLLDEDPKDTTASAISSDPEDPEDILLLDPELTARAEVLVRNIRVSIDELRQNPLIRHALQHERRSEDVIQTVGFPSSRGTIRCRLTAPDTLGMLGHEFPLVVDIRNDSFKVLRKVSLALFMEYSTVNNHDVPGTVERIEKKMYKKRLPLIEHDTHWLRRITGFVIPIHCMTSVSLLPCTFVALRFFVRLKLKWMFGSMKADTTVYLGTHGTQRSHSQAGRDDLRHHLE